MQKLEIYRFEKQDPPWDNRIDQAFNRLLEFAEELRQPENKKDKVPQRTAFNRILGGEFDGCDINCVVEYAKTVADRAMTKYTQEPMAKAPWAKTVLQAAQNLVDTVNDFVEWWKHHECQYDREPGAM